MLVGPSGSGKSTWAAARYRSSEIVSSDALRAVLGSGEHDQDASADAFDLLERIVTARLKRGLTTVIDTLGFEAPARRRWRELARAAGLSAVVVRFEVPERLARQRNRERDRTVPDSVLTKQFQRAKAVPGQVAAEGWDSVVVVIDTGAPSPAAPSPEAVSAGRDDAGHPEIVLQLSRFPWGDDPVAWLRDVALAAADAGLRGIALMDHLIQIPQVGREWEPIPEPFVTLGHLAALDTNLRLGTLCTPITFRPPGVVAKAVATLDVLSGGRAFLGVGAGWWEREHRGFGVPFPPMAARQDSLEAHIETIRALWAPGTKRYQGGRVDLPETTCYPRPLGSPPIIVGGGGERRTLATAARLGDACNLPSDPKVLARKLPILRRHCEEAGRDPDEVAVTVLDLPVVGRDREDTWARVERLRGRAPAAAFAARHNAGSPAQHRERYLRLAEVHRIKTVFVAPVGLSVADDVSLLAGLVAR